MLLLTIVGLVLYYLYLKCIKPLSYWKDRGVPYVKPWPVLGSFHQVYLQKKSFPEIGDLQYKMFPNERYFGTFNLNMPFLVIRDLDLLKQITITDFDHFQDHNILVREDVDPLWGKTLLACRGQYWRNMRSTLSPAFTSSKMKAMFVLIDDAAKQFAKYFVEHENDLNMLEMKDVFTRFTNDVVATCAFGINCDSLANRENEFYMMGKDATDFSGLKGLKFIFGGVSPFLMKLFGITIFSKAVRGFFSDIIKNTMRLRDAGSIKRPDMIQLLMAAKKGQLKHDDAKDVDTSFATVEESDLGKTSVKETILWTDEDLISQALIFFIAGFDTTSSLLSFLSYELALNPEVQQRLHEEIVETEMECNGKINYDVLLKMKYLDMVISETLRKYPPLPNTDRLVTKDYTIEPVLPHEKAVYLKAGDAIGLNFYSIQRDATYFPEPDNFDPERFSDENKGNIIPGSFLAFGIGPRNCIGSRFALLETKTLLYHFLKEFEIMPNEKTPIPIIHAKFSFNIQPEGGFWLSFKRRSKK